MEVSSGPTLYYRPTCPYSRRVLDTAEELGVPLALKDTNDPQFAEELLQKGGRPQVPYLVDDAHGVSMYESMDIVAYLHDRYA